MPRRAARPKNRSASEKRYYYGANERLIGSKDPEFVLSGPAGTGKSLACLHKLHACAQTYPGMRGLIVRKTRSALTETVLVTFENRLLGPYWFKRIASNAQRPQRHSYIYPNGSELVVGGLDKPSKVMSAEYDIIYPNEIIEFTEGDIEALSSRLRNGVMPYQQLIADTNPDAPTHWLRRRADSGGIRMEDSRHEDNPHVWDADRGDWTEAGAMYIARLERLTGVRLLRLRKGLWVGAEGLIYDEWDPAVHGLVPPDFRPKYHVGSQDWGYTNPGCLGIWGVDGDGRMALVREVYHTGKLIGWWTDRAADAHRVFQLDALVCDPSEPAYIATFRDAGLPAIPGYNPVDPGIQAVKARLKLAGDGRPRIHIPAIDPAAKDPALAEAGKPTCTHEEMTGYVRIPGREEPKKVNDHGMDQARYAAAYVDGLGREPEGELTVAENPIVWRRGVG